MERFLLKRITRHGGKRLKKRLGLKKKAHRRHIEKVLDNGNYYYIDIKYLHIWFNYHEYIFVRDNKNRLYTIFITVLPKNKNIYKLLKE